MKSSLSYINTIFLVTLLLLVCSCGSGATAEKDASKAGQKSTASFKKKAVPGSMSKGGITLTPVADSPDYSDATLTLRGPSASSELASGKTNFWYDVKNYELGNQTPDAPQKSCANSAKGQHIHLILNNQPYSAYYTNKFSKELPDNYYVALAFISRSYHESIKNKGAYALHDFTVGQKMSDGPQVDLKAEHLFYSRPKGKYIGAGNIEKVMLDFYLVNTEIGKNGNKVRATINGTAFTIDKWQPYMMEGLPMGTNKIKLELIDSKGQAVEGPFNVVEREFQLYKEEPIG